MKFDKEVLELLNDETFRNGSKYLNLEEMGKRLNMTNKEIEHMCVALMVEKYIDFDLLFRCNCGKLEGDVNSLGQFCNECSSEITRKNAFVYFLFK